MALALAAGPARATPAAAVRALAARYAAHLLADRPDLASRYGLAHADDRLEPVTEATLARDAALLGALADSAAAVDRARLRRADAALLDTLCAHVAAEAAPLAADAWRRRPEAYLALAEDAVLAAARQPRVSACERTRRATRRLRAVPEVLRAAEVNLRAATYDRDDAVARWRAAMVALRTELPAVAATCHDSERYADLVEADSLALEAARRFVRFLGEDAGRASGR